MAKASPISAPASGARHATTLLVDRKRMGVRVRNCYLQRMNFESS